MIKHIVTADYDQCSGNGRRAFAWVVSHGHVSTLCECKGKTTLFWPQILLELFI